MQEEIWKTIPGFNNYQVSNLGNVKSLRRLDTIGRIIHERILKPGLNDKGYYIVSLAKEGRQHTKKVHQLVAMAFLNHTPCGYALVVDHINEIKTDNRSENLRLVTHRFNLSRGKRMYSKYVGVTYNKVDKIWCARIFINHKKIHLGSFKTEYEAHLAYQEALKQVTNKNK